MWELPMYSRPFTGVIYNSICNYSPILYLQGPFFYRVSSSFVKAVFSLPFCPSLQVPEPKKTHRENSMEFEPNWRIFERNKSTVLRSDGVVFLPPKNESYAQAKLDHFPTVSRGYLKRTPFKNHHVYRCPQGLEPVIFTANIASNPFQSQKKLPSQNSPNTKIR